MITTTKPKPLLAYRPFKEVKAALGVEKNETKVSLERNPVPPSGPSPCTYIGYTMIGNDAHCPTHP